jgi:hypothetical protein
MSRLPPDQAIAESTSPVPWWLGRLQWEGIASLLDKRNYVRLTTSGLVPTEGVSGFALEHATRVLSAPAVLAIVDRALVARRRAASGSAAADSVLRNALEAAIPDGGHALGQYMAFVIEQHGGRSAIIRATTSRVLFLRAYQEAAMAPGSIARPFSSEAMAHVLDVER